jgi:DNA excision repair protein ERCC-6
LQELLQEEEEILQRLQTYSSFRPGESSSQATDRLENINPKENVDEEIDRPGDNDPEVVLEDLIRTGKLNPFSTQEEIEQAIRLESEESSGRIQKETHLLIPIPGPRTPHRKKLKRNHVPDSDFESGVSGTSSNEESEADEPDDVEEEADDGNEISYRERLLTWSKNNYEARTGHSPPQDGTFEAEKELCQPGTANAIQICKNLYLPSSLSNSLFRYQITCIKWLWELHQQKVGGIIGDEMGTNLNFGTAACLLQRNRFQWHKLIQER